MILIMITRKLTIMLIFVVELIWLTCMFTSTQSPEERYT